MRKPVHPSPEIDLASYQLLVESVREYAIFMLDPDGYVMTWNQGAERIKGYTSEEIIGQHFSCFYPPEDVKSGKTKRVLATAAGEGKYVEEGWRVRKDGELFWASVTLTALHDANGKLSGFAKVTRDMTEHKRYEDSLRAANESLEARVQERTAEWRAVFDQGPTCMAKFDLSGRWIEANPRFCELVGYSTDELKQLNYRDLGTPEENDDAEAWLRKLLSGEVESYARERNLRRKDGAPLTVELSLSLLRDRANAPLYFIGVCKDITERQRADRALREALRENRRIMDHSLDMICSMNARGEFVQVSAASERLLGYKPEEMIGRSFLDFVYPEDRAVSERRARAIVHGHAAEDFENRYVRKDGALVELMWSSRWSEEEQRYFSIARDVTESRRAQQALAQSEETFRSTVELAPVGIVHTGLDHELLQVNAAYCQMLGYTRDELMRLKFDQISHPDDLARTHESLQKIRAGERAQDAFEKRYIRKDGEVVWARVRTTLKCDPLSGAPQHFISIAEDITAHRAAMEGLKLAEQRVRTILESISNAFFAVDNDWRFTYLNHRAEQLLMREADELLGHELWQEFPEAADDIFAREYRQARVTGQAAQFEAYFAPLNAWFAVSAYPHAEGLSVYFDNITERKRLELALRKSEEMFRRTFEQAAVGISYTNLDGTLRFVNSQYCAILGYSQEELEQRSYLDITHPDDRAESQKRVQALLSGTVESFVMEKRFIRKSRHVIWVSVSASLSRHPVTDAPEHIIAVIQDITQRKRMEEAVRQAEEHFRLLVEGTEDYAIIRLDRYGNVASWNPGAEKILGYQEKEIIGQHFSRFYTFEDSMNGEPQRKLSRAIREGRAENDRWHLRKDGSRFWGNGVINALYDDDGNVQGFVKIMRDITERKMAEDRTQYLANHDSLTGLPNRAHFSDRLHAALAYAQREQAGMALLMLDLDRFKSINDTLGHDMGDLLLKEVATRLLACVRETDTVARLGGDEFVVIQTGVTSEADACALAQKIVSELARPYFLNGQDVKSGTSIGVTVYPRDAEDVSQLLKNADLALYRAKDHGRHNYQLYTDDMHAAILGRQRMEQELRQALDNQEFSLCFQPQIDLTSWQVTGVEALLRWRNPGLALLAPAEFLDLAHETGLIVPIGEWVLRAACQQNKAWQDAGIPPFRVGVNFSAREVEDPGFINLVRRVLQETGLSPHCLEIEITEGQLIRDRESTLSLLHDLQGMGVKISADDFGAGLSNLNTLKRFPVDTLKIDRSVIEHIAHNRHDSAIAAAIIGLGRDLNVRVVAEGVETLEQLVFLQAEGCTSAQGFLFSPPVSARSLEALLRDGNWSRMNPS